MSFLSPKYDCHDLSCWLLDFELLQHLDHSGITMFQQWWQVIPPKRSLKIWKNHLGCVHFMLFLIIIQMYWHKFGWHLLHTTQFLMNISSVSSILLAKSCWSAKIGSWTWPTIFEVDTFESLSNFGFQNWCLHNTPMDLFLWGFSTRSGTSFQHL